MNSLERLFAVKLTENGDKAFNTTGNNLLDILFMTEYYSKHLTQVEIGTSDKEQLFSMFIRDPRYGIGKRDLGKELMLKSEVSPENIVKSGRFDDLWQIGMLHFYRNSETNEYLEFLHQQVLKGNELAKKWCPRYSSKDLGTARELAKMWGLNKQQYGKLIKCNTVENKLSRKKTEEIEFDKIPSLALLKYYKRFENGEDTKNRFAKYLEDVKKGNKKLNMSTTTVYDIYKNRNKIDADLFFNKLEKISINCVPIVDTSGSMYDSNDSIGKALSIGHYLGKCTSYCNGNVVSFSSRPKLLKIEGKDYNEELKSMYTGDCSNTDFRKVMELFKDLEDMPEFLVVLSDMEFDCGSNQSKEQLMELWKEKGYKTKIVWWNLNSRNSTVPELDECGNIYMSGYSPYLLKFLEVGFDGEKFLNKLLEEYAKKL